MPNDPQWGKKNNDGPPDLDEILRKLQQKIAGWLGFTPRGPDVPRGPAAHRNMSAGGGIALLVILVVAAWLFSGFYIVDEGHRAVELRLGRFKEITQPGLRWHIPYPIESKEDVDVSRVRTVDVGYRQNPRNKQPQESLMLTDDENIVDVQFAIQWTLNVGNPDAPRDYLFNNKNPDDNVLQAAETAIREVVGKSKMDFVLNQGRSEISSRVKALMQQILDRYGTGILVTTVALQGAAAPEQVQGAFEDVVRAGQDRERFKNEGQAYANNVIPTASGVASRTLAEANGYKASVVAAAQGDVARFKAILAEYEKAPQVTRERMYLDTMERVLSSTSKVIVDTKGGNNLLYLPIDKIMRLSGEQSQAPANAEPARPGISVPEAIPTPAPEAPLSRRDALRSRDRDAGR